MADQKGFQLLTIYEGRIHRNMTKNLQQLTELQAVRHAAEASRACSGTKLLKKPAASPNSMKWKVLPAIQPPASHTRMGLVFSNAEIAQFIRYLRRLDAARSAFPLPQPRKIDLKRTD
jgi:hypothetical protein